MQTAIFIDSRSYKGTKVAKGTKAAQRTAASRASPFVIFVTFVPSTVV